MSRFTYLLCFTFQIFCWRRPWVVENSICTAGGRTWRFVTAITSLIETNVLLLCQTAACCKCWECFKAVLSGVETSSHRRHWRDMSTVWIKSETIEFAASVSVVWIRRYKKLAAVVSTRSVLGDHRPNLEKQNWTCVCFTSKQELLRLYENLACVEMKLKKYRLVIKNVHLALGISRTSAKAFYLKAKVMWTSELYKLSPVCFGLSVRKNCMKLNSKDLQTNLPSLLWYCWIGDRRGIALNMLSTCYSYVWCFLILCHVVAVLLPLKS